MNENDAFLFLLQAISYHQHDLEEDRNKAEELVSFLEGYNPLAPHKAILKELLTMSIADTRNHEGSERAAFLGEDYQRTRELGQELNILGGYKLMSWIHHKIPRYDQRKLEVAWNGVGDWAG